MLRRTRTGPVGGPAAGSFNCSLVLVFNALLPEGCHDDREERHYSKKRTSVGGDGFPKVQRAARRYSDSKTSISPPVTRLASPLTASSPARDEDGRQRVIAPLSGEPD